MAGHPGGQGKVSGASLLTKGRQKEKKSDTGVLPASNTHPPSYYYYFFFARCHDNDKKGKMHKGDVTAATAAQPPTLQVLGADTARACGG